MKTNYKGYSTINNIIYLFRAVAKERPFLFFLMLTEIVASVISPVIGIYLPSLAVSLVTEKAVSHSLLIKLGGLGLILAVLLGLQQMASEGKYILSNSMRRFFQIRLLSHSMRCDYENIESQEGLTKYRRSMETLFDGDWSGTSVMQVSTVALIINILCFIIYSGVLTTLHPLIVLLLISLSILNLFLTRFAQKYEHNLRDEQARLNQKTDYVNWTARDTQYGKDIRIYNMSDWLIDIQNGLIEACGKLQNHIRNRYFLVSCLNILTLFLRDGVSYGYLIYSVLTGHISVNEFVLYLGAVTGFSNFILNISEQVNALHGSSLKMNDLRSFLDTSNIHDPEHPADIPPTDKLSIDFDHVWFSYNKEGAPVLKDFTFHIEPGEKIALVGINGAGKTTLVKLLCGLYHPDRGEIRINGISVERFRRDDLFQLFSAVFQDLYIPPHSVAENISMRPEEESDIDRAEQCLKQVGLYHVIHSYPDHIHTKMTKQIHNGIQLSGGQQQKLLMARALYKDAPVMILDEPTAALDPIAESETYESFRLLAGGKTVIYISHRLASTRFCDRIAFLKDGKITESGTHEELMKYAGDYSEMFAVQSHYYQKGVSHENKKTAE